MILFIIYKDYVDRVSTTQKEITIRILNQLKINVETGLMDIYIYI